MVIIVKNSSNSSCPLPSASISAIMCHTASALASIPKELMLSFSSDITNWRTFGVDGSSPVVVEQVERLLDLEHLVGRHKLVGVGTGVEPGQPAREHLA